MWWRGASKNKYIVACFVLLFAIALPIPLHAANTQVDVLICNPSTTAQLTINEPQSDSTSTSPNIAIKGTALYTSQIEIYVDGGYNKTIALANGVTTFETNIRITPGTHTISLTAIDVCGGAPDTKHLVITYQQQPRPTPGPSPQPDPSRPDSDQASRQGRSDSGQAGSDGSVTPGRDIDTDLPSDPGKDEGQKEREPWPLSYVNPSPLTFLLRALIAFAGALLLSIRRRHIAKMFNQPLTAKWPFIPCSIMWAAGTLLILFAIFGYIF